MAAGDGGGTRGHVPQAQFYGGGGGKWSEYKFFVAFLTLQQGSKLKMDVLSIGLLGLLLNSILGLIILRLIIIVIIIINTGADTGVPEGGEEIHKHPSPLETLPA